MYQKFRRMREERAEGGFTLIELLVVVVIIGILVSIAIPVYLNYRKGAANKTAQSDVRAGITAIEEYYTENGNTYPTATQTIASVAGATAVMTFAPTVGTPQKINISSGNTLNYRYVAATNYYVICGQNVDGKQIYVYNSSNSQAVVKSTQTTIARCSTAGN
jgi:type IV pilus assembly protein PilA